MPDSVALIFAFASTEGVAVKILKDEIVTMEILRRQGETNQAIAKRGLVSPKAAFAITSSEWHKRLAMGELRLV